MVMNVSERIRQKHIQCSTIDSSQTVLASLSLSLFAFSLSFLSLPFLLYSPFPLLPLLLLLFFNTYAGVEPRLFQVDGYGVIQKALARSVLVAKALLPVG